MNGKAFTLPELLVVVGIVAVLASVLFPVFAQQKTAAKETELSDTHQLARAELLYQSDYNDYFVPATAWNDGGDPFCLGPNTCFSTWSWIISPFLTDANALDEPSDIYEIYFPSFSAKANHTLFMPFGYNYEFLSPVVGPGQQAQSASSAQDPERTVMVTSKWLHKDQTDWQNMGLYSLEFPGGAMEDAVSEGVVCNAIAQGCFSDWGHGDLWDTGMIFGNTPETDGKYTAGNAFREEDKVTVAWLDGHADKSGFYELASGTDFDYNAPAGSPGSAGDITVVHARDYRWSLVKDCSNFVFPEGGGCSE